MSSSNGGDGNDVHDQLKNINNRMSRTADISQSMKEAQDQLESHLKHVASLKGGSAGDDEQSKALRNRLSDLQQEYSQVLQEGQSLSAKNHLSSQGTISPSKKPTRSSQKNKNSKSNDVKFAADLSEQMLMECRRLQGVIVDRDRAIKDLQAEHEVLKSKSASLESQVHAMSESEEKFKDENWNLEFQLQELRKESNKNSEHLNRANNEAGKLQKDRNTQIDTIESLKLKESELKKELAALKSKYESELKSTKNEQDDLKAENFQLHQSVTDLKQELESQKSIGAIGPSGDIPFNDGALEDIIEDDGFDTPDNSPPISPMKATPSRNSALEAETVKSSLGHAHKIVMNLRKALQKERSEKNDLERMLSDARQELDDSQSAPTSLKSKRSKHKIAGVAGLGANRKATARVYEHPSDSPTFGHAEGWEETTSESEFQSAFETAPDDPTDDNYQTGQETMDEGSDDGQHTETEDTTTTTPRQFGFHVDSSGLSTSEEEGAGDSSTLSRAARRRNSRYRRSHFSLKSAAATPSSSSANGDTPVKGQSLANEFMSVEDVEQHAADLGLVTMSNEEYEELVAKADAPTSEQDLAAAAAAMDMQIIPASQLRELQSHVEQSKSQDFIVKAASGFGLVAISKQDFDKFKTPSVEDVHSHAQNLGLKAVKLNDHDKLVNDHKEIVEKHNAVTGELKDIKQRHEGVLKEHTDLLASHKDLTSNHEQLQSELASTKEAHSALGTEFEQAKEAHNKTSAQLQSLQLEHDDLVKKQNELSDKHNQLSTKNEELSKELSRDLTPDELAARANTIGHVSISSEEYFQLVRSVNSPSLDEVSKGAKKLDMVAIPKSDFDQLTQIANDPTEDDLKAKASGMGLSVIDLSYYKELKRLAERPSAEEITQSAQKLGYSVIGTAEYNELIQNANDPSLDHLKSKADTHHKSRIIPHDEYETLAERANNPSTEHITSKASGLGLKVVPAEDYESMVKKIDEPDESHIKSKAVGLGLVALGAAEHKKLLRAIEKPTRDEVETKAKDHGLVTLDAQSHEELVRTAHDPSVEEVTAKARALGYTIVGSDEYEKLIKSAKEPTADELKENAQKVGLVAINKDEYSRLSNPTPEDVENLAKTHGLVAVPVAKYQNIKDAAEAPPTKSWVESAAASLGLATLGTAELANLKKPPPEPTLDDARKISEKHGHSLLSNGDVTALKNPQADQVKKMAEKHGFVTLPTKEYENLVKPYAPTKEEIEAKAESYGLVTVPEDVYTKLTTEPTKEQLSEKASKAGLVVVPKNDFDELSSRPKEYSPSKEELSTHAKSLGLSILPVAEHESLSKQVSEPSREVVEKSASKQGLTLVPMNDLEELKRKGSSPSKEELNTLATQAGYALVTVSALQDLNKRAEEPAKDVVLRSAKKHDLVMLSSNDHDELRRLADEPTAEEVKEAASAVGLETIPIAQYQELTRKAQQPTPAEIELACEANDMVAVSKSEYELLEKNAEDPDKDLLNKHAVRLGLSVMAAGEVEELRRKANQPTKEDLEQIAKNKGLVVLSKEQYTQLVDRADKLQQQSTRNAEGSNTLLLSSVAAKRDHFEDIIKQSNSQTAQGDKIVESMKSLGYVPVAHDEYKRLLEAQQAFEPTKREILRHVKTLGMVAIGAEEYKSLVKRGHVASPSVSSDVLEEAMSSSAAASPRSSRTRNLSIDTQDEETSKPAGMELQSVPAEYLATLRRIAENPTAEDVELLSKKAGLVALPLPEGEEAEETGDKDKTYVAVSSDEYSRLKNYTADADVIAARAKELDMVTLSTEEYLELTTTNKEQLQEKAGELGLVVMEQSKFNEVSKPIEERARGLGLSMVPVDYQMSMDELKTEAGRLGMSVVPISETKRVSISSDSSHFLSQAEIQEHADHAGLKAIPVSEYEGLQAVKSNSSNARAPMTETELSNHAKDLGLILLSTQEYRRMSGNYPKTPPTPNNWTLDDVRVEANKLGYTVIPEGSTGRSADLFGAGAVGAAAGAAVGAVAGANIPQSNSEATLKEVRGSPVVINNARHHVQSAVLEDAASDTSTEDAHSQQRGQLPLVVEDGVMRNLSQTSVQSRSTSGGTGTGGLMEAPNIYKNGSATTSPGARSATNLAVSNATINTAASLNEKNMIPYVTQVVIGEFLFKYTRRIGVSGISDNRHERYFWVHPYSMTLYWSKENPAMESNRNTKTKSAAILAVRSVDDHNPLPPGLHHKSLMIETSERTIKLTCPTRQRHNVWYNSLLFLLRRSAEDLVLEEEDEERADNGAESHNSPREPDTRFERERARTISAGTPRGRPKVLSLRRSLAPEMNTNTSRHPSTSSFQRPTRSSQELR